jgi:hypothetical protein
MLHEPPRRERRERPPAKDDPAAVREQLGKGDALDPVVRADMERAYGMSFANVQVHSDAHAAALSSSLSARAFTVGEHIAFNRGEYRPGTIGGDAIIAHELAHVAQQRGSGPQVARLGVEPERSVLETEANSSARRALLGESAAPANRARGLTLQRCTSPSFKTTGGEFKFEKYDKVDTDAGNDSAKSVGVDVKIVFTPNGTVVSDKISFVQIVRSTMGGTPDYLFPHQKGRSTTAAEGEEGWRVDRVDAMKSPNYGEQNTGLAGGNTHFGSRTAAGAVDPAWLTDRPTRSRSPGQAVTWRGFSFALDNPGSKYLGGVQWGFDCSTGGAVSLVTPSVASMGDPAGIQRKALDRWNTQAAGPVADRNDPGQLAVPTPP